MYASIYTYMHAYIMSACRYVYTASMSSYAQTRENAIVRCESGQGMTQYFNIGSRGGIPYIVGSMLHVHSHHSSGRPSACCLWFPTSDHLET